MLFGIKKKKQIYPKAMAIFGSATKDIAVKCRATVFKTGALLAKHNVRLVYGVGDDGMMGTAYQGVRSEKGKVLGITLPLLLKRQCADPTIYGKGELKLVDNLDERKYLMLKNSDALLIAPGGWGTLDEIATYAVHFKIGDWQAVPIIFLNYRHYWDGFLKFVKQMEKDGAVTSQQIAFIGSIKKPKDIFKEYRRILKQIEKYQAKNKWKN